MKRKLILSTVAAALLAAPAFATLSVQESTEPEYLINAGYSQAAAEDVFVLKNRVHGQPIEPLYEKSQNKFVRACKKIYSYMDPSVDEADRIHHDIHLSPSFSDL